MGKVIMVQGTASNAGKSVLVAALCRIFAQDGLRVAPFKAQNMSLNSGVTPDGLEIGRAQIAQAEAAGIPPMVEMNPVLLKPEADNRSQVVVMGKPLSTASAQEYYARRKDLWPIVTAALDALRAQYDVVVIEGAGSPAEINLRQYDIVNMRVALYANAPVLLVADIDRGGVFAALYGTVALVEPEERERIKAFVINKFRGDVTLLQPGLTMIEERTGVPVAGVVPYYHDIYIPEEDSVDHEIRARRGSPNVDAVLDIAVISLPHVANFDDFDPLAKTPGVNLRYIAVADQFGQPDLVIIPGTKTTVADLDWMRRTGIADLVIAHRHDGAPVIGICGGYQMIGEWILDPQTIESSQERIAGLGLLPVTTEFVAEKSTHQVQARIVGGNGLLSGANGATISGYEIHMGRTSSLAGDSPPIGIETRSGQPVNDEQDGFVDSEGKTLGTYLHGLFHNQILRSAILDHLAEIKGVTLPSDVGFATSGEYDKLAALVRQHVDMAMVYSLLNENASASK